MESIATNCKYIPNSFDRKLVRVVPVNIRSPIPHGTTAHQIEGSRFFIIKFAGKIRISLLFRISLQGCPEFSILQTIYPYIALVEKLATNMKVWIFLHLCHHPRIFASQQLHVPGFSVIFACRRIFSSIVGVRILTGTTLRISLGLS